MEVARLTAVIDANTGGFKRGLAGVEAGMLRTRAGMQAMDGDTGRAGRGLMNFGNVGKIGLLAVGGAAVAAGAAVAVGVGYGVKSLMTFDKSMSKVKAVTGATQGDMEKFRKAAMDAGMTTKFSALEAAEAQVELGKAGMSTKDIIGGGFKAALNLAAAGEMNLADAASTTSNIMGTFGIKAKNAGHVADALAQAANSTTADVGDFAMAMQMGGSAAKLAGLDMDQTVVALEALAKIGIKGSDAGTSLKASLVQIAKPTKESMEAMKAHNLQFFKANGEMKDMATISGMLRKETGNMTKQQRLALFATVAGTDGMRTLAALYSSTPDQLKKYGAELGKQGTAAEQARVMNDNLAGALSTMKNSFQVVAMQVGSAFIPLLTLAAKGITSLMQALSNSGAIQAFAGGVQTVTAAISGLFGGGGNDTSAKAGTLAASLGSMGAAAGTAGQAMQSLSGGVGSVRATLSTMGSILSGLGPVISTIANTIRSGLTTQFQALRTIGAALAPVLSQAFTTIGPPLARLAVALGNIIAILVKVNVAIMSGIYKTLAVVLPPVIHALAPVFAVAFRAIANVINMISALLEGDFTGAFKYAVAAVKAIWITIPSMLAGVLVRAIGAVAGYAADLGSRLISGIASAITSGAGRIGSAISSAIKDAITSIDIPGFSPPEHAAAQAIGEPLAKGVKMGFLNGTADLPEKIEGRLKASLERGKRAVERQQGALQGAFGKLGSGMMRAFDAQTQKGVAGLQKTGAELTPAEAALAAEQQAHDDQQRLADRAAADAALAKAQAEGDAQAIADAQARVNELSYQDRIAALQRTAEAERKARDDDTAQKVLDYEAEREAQRTRYEEQIADLEKFLERRNVSQAAKNKKLTALLNDPEMRSAMKDSGVNLGKAFATGLTDSKKDVRKAIKDLAEEVAKFLKLNSPAKKGPLSSLDSWWTAMPDTLLSGVDGSMIGQVAAGIASPDGVGGSGGASGQNVTVIVNVEGSVTAEADLADTIRKQLIKTGQRSGSIFGGLA